mmetsp:Transcript_7775/g.11790  ORF Transcript_7775/g.11790 Transcript_7775/m.11790 type:complete len:97 (-) Transcript_7775:1130-1420(-)
MVSRSSFSSSTSSLPVVFFSYKLVATDDATHTIKFVQFKEKDKTRNETQPSHGSISANVSHSLSLNSTSMYTIYSTHVYPSPKYHPNYQEYPVAKP